MRSRGNVYEKLAVKHLKQHRVKILSRNLIFPGGEIDIVGQEGDVLLFIEVKGRKSASHGQPSEFVDHRKQRRIIHCAEQYLQQHQLYHMACRFDVMSLIHSDTEDRPTITIDWIKNAFTL